MKLIYPFGGQFSLRNLKPVDIKGAKATKRVLTQSTFRKCRGGRPR
jgi:hypothetical protein